MPRPERKRHYRTHWGCDPSPAPTDFSGDGWDFYHWAWLCQGHSRRPSEPGYTGPEGPSLASDRKETFREHGIGSKRKRGTVILTEGLKHRPQGRGTPYVRHAHTIACCLQFSNTAGLTVHVFELQKESHVTWEEDAIYNSETGFKSAKLRKWML